MVYETALHYIYLPQLITNLEWTSWKNWDVHGKILINLRFVLGSTASRIIFTLSGCAFIWISPTNWHNENETTYGFFRIVLFEFAIISCSFKHVSLGAPDNTWSHRFENEITICLSADTNSRLTVLGTSSLLSALCFTFSTPSVITKNTLAYQLSYCLIFNTFYITILAGLSII